MQPRRSTILLSSVLIGLAILSISARAQLTEVETKAATLGGGYSVIPNVVYLTANNYQDKLDIYQPAGDNPHPTLIYFHGGGWMVGNKEESVLQMVPYLDKGWVVVNVEYRLGPVSLAPAAVEDCRCALRWVIEHAKEYSFDVNRIVVTGESAGGHLALTTGMLPLSAGLDRECAENSELKVAAIIDWYGITDVNELFEGADRQWYAVARLGSPPDREEIAKAFPLML